MDDESADEDIVNCPSFLNHFFAVSGLISGLMLISSLDILNKKFLVLFTGKRVYYLLIFEENINHIICM